MSQNVEVTFNGVETPKRLQNAVDVKNGVVRHTFDVRARDIDAEKLRHLSAPNPRTPNVRTKLAKQVKSSLVGDDQSTVGYFHLAHSGCRGIVSSFTKLNDTTYKATFIFDEDSETGDGIANGLHTIALIQEALQEGVEIPEDQYITFTLVENVDALMVPYIGKGLNTNIQVAEESILNLGHKFDPFKDAIKDTSYSSLIGWQENDKCEYDARDVFAILTALNVALYPNHDIDRNPIESYEKQSQCIEKFKEFEQTYLAMVPILRDALCLYDHIRHDPYDLYRRDVPDGKAGGLAILEGRLDRQTNQAKPNFWQFPFMSDGSGTIETGTYRLSKGAAFAMLAAFRNFVEYDEDSNTMKWTEGFDEVLKAWNAIGGSMTRAAHEVSKSVNYNPNAVGKHRPLWQQLHQMVANHRLESEMEMLRARLASAEAQVAKQ